MGLCGEPDNIDKTKIYGVMPYVAPEVLRGNPYTQAADIYSFGMIMYFVATGKQPFYKFAHDQYLALKICNGIRPEINKPEVPKCYIDLMKKYWDSNPDNRPTTFVVRKLISEFYDSIIKRCMINYDLTGKRMIYEEIQKLFKNADEYKETNYSSIKNNQSTTHPKACYTSRLLNPFTKDLPRYDNIDNNTAEFTNFTE
ncbi:kinase-like domain-containing protein [Glomus cerebriforme]|uniref:Kinase-like domain-containing protein n=1 Tax=Glomus cerebriforme TaxID=658196 RepID=A0A397T3D5_9GLOM|nr:kinase-like domain-containing protein [Glomus cerebriforme]